MVLDFDLIGKKNLLEISISSQKTYKNSSI